MASKERQSLYQDASVQQLLNRFAKGEIVELTPIFDLNHTVRYPEAEAAVDGDPSAAKQLVEKLWDQGIFKRRLYEKILVCPSCISPNITTDYACPNCKSIDLDRRTLLEHTACGTIDSLDSFLVKGGLLCPKCNREMVQAGIDYQKLGAWFQCNQCGKRSDFPSPIHRCRNCGHIFTIKDTGFVNTYTYRVSTEAEEEFRRSHVAINPLRTVLEDFQFQVETPGQIAGRSGALHSFDITASKGTFEVVVLDIIAKEKQIDEPSVASVFAKIFDVAPSLAILVAIPNITDKARRLVQLYKIALIEASSPQAAAGQLRDKLSLASEQLKDKFSWTGLTQADETPEGLEQ